MVPTVLKWLCRLADLFDIPLELLVPNRQSVEELLQSDRGARLPGTGGLLHNVASVVKHQFGAYLAGLMACNHTQVTATTSWDEG